MKILYVEDNPANISLLQRIARMGGHQVINYTNGEKALNNFKQDQPDLVLMDLQLEGRVSGLDVVKKLRAQGFKTPIVAVTAYAMVGDRERCIEAGCDSYLSKPLPVAELVELVQKYELKFKEKPVARSEKMQQTAVLPQRGDDPTLLSREHSNLETSVPATKTTTEAKPSSPASADPKPNSSSVDHAEAKPSSPVSADPKSNSSPVDHVEAKPSSATRADPKPNGSAGSHTESKPSSAQADPAKNSRT